MIICALAQAPEISQPGSIALSQPPKGLTQAEWSKLLPLLHQTPLINGKTFNPLLVIKIVNALQPLGKEKALNALDEYARITPHPIERLPNLKKARYDEDQIDTREGLYLVLRVLFEVPQDVGYMPFIEIGEPNPPLPYDIRAIPRFPIVIIDDVPLLLTERYILTNRYRSEGPRVPRITPVESHLAYFREYGTIRKQPLRPTDQPFNVLTKLEASRQWLYGVYYVGRWPDTGAIHPPSHQQGKQMLYNQLVRLVRSAYNVSKKHTDLQPYWNPDKNEYEVFSLIRPRSKPEKRVRRSGGLLCSGA